MGEQGKRGRPKKPESMNAAERKRRQRAKDKNVGMRATSENIVKILLECTRLSYQAMLNDANAAFSAVEIVENVASRFVEGERYKVREYFKSQTTASADIDPSTSDDPFAFVTTLGWT